MDMHGEIAKMAHELYEKGGFIHGRDLDNWLEAERIVMERNKKKSSASRSGPKSGKTKKK
jgi:hypothetical protein